jgi:hypothetical protein
MEAIKKKEQVDLEFLKKLQSSSPNFRKKYGMLYKIHT